MAITDLEPRLLVEAHNDGDERAFRQIVLAHHQALFAHAISRLHDVHAAEDAVQETFVRAYRAMPSFQGDFHLRAWLHRILTNVCHDEGGRRQRDGLLFERVSCQAVLGADPADADIERLDVSRDVVAEALAALPDSHREALLLRYVSELSYEEVGAATGVTAGNARVRVMRGRIALQRALTGSHAVLIGLLPWLRRGGRGPSAIADLQLAGAASLNASAVGAPSLLASTPTLVAGSPLLLRAADTAPQLAERMATLPQVLGLVATMAVPIAAPVVSDQVAAWVSGPPAISAAPAEDQQVAAADAPAATAADPAASVVPATTGEPTSPVTAVSAGAAPVGPATTSTSTATSTSSSTASTTSSTSTPTTTVRTGVPVTEPVPTAVSPAPVPGAPRPAAPRPAAPPAPLVAYASSLSGERITSVGDQRTELAGGIRWDLGGTTGDGDLSGSLVFDRPRVVEVEVDVATDPALTARRQFTGALTLSLEDGRAYRLLLTEGALDDVSVGTAMTATFELRDACDAVVATGAVTGDLDLQEAPVPSALALSLDGSGPADIAPCG